MRSDLWPRKRLPHRLFALVRLFLLSDQNFGNMNVLYILAETRALLRGCTKRLAISAFKWYAINKKAVLHDRHHAQALRSCHHQLLLSDENLGNGRAETVSSMQCTVERLCTELSYINLTVSSTVDPRWRFEDASSWKSPQQCRGAGEATPRTLVDILWIWAFNKYHFD